MSEQLTVQLIWIMAVVWIACRFADAAENITAMIHCGGEPETEEQEQEA